MTKTKRQARLWVDYPRPPRLDEKAIDKVWAYLVYYCRAILQRLDSRPAPGGGESTHVVDLRLLFIVARSALPSSAEESRWPGKNSCWFMRAPLQSSFQSARLWWGPELTDTGSTRGETAG